MFCRSPKKNSYALQPMESNYKKYASIQMMLSIKLKFDMRSVDHPFSYYINFGVSRVHSFFTGYTKLCMVIIGNNVHSIYSSFSWKHLILLYITGCLYIYIYWNTGWFKLVYMPDCNQMFGKSNGDTPHFFFSRTEVFVAYFRTIW